jgi:hypothetical protein
MIRARIAICAIALCCLTLPAFAQVDGDDTSPMTGDSLEMQNDTLNPDSAFFQSMDEDSDAEPLEPDTFFRVRGGFFGGPVIELTTLDPHTLDPDLDGQLVLYGAQGYILLDSWLFGGMGLSGHLYDLGPTYDRFDYGYGGFLTGYDTKIFHGALTMQARLMIGAGGIELLKKRPALIDSTGHPILEQYRQESFFCLRPGISLGYSPRQFVEFRLAADYLYPIGGARVDDLRNLTYGLHIMLAIGD